MARAFLVIDIQNDYFPGGVLPLWQAEDTETRLLPILRKAREAGDRVILVRHLSKAETGLFASGGTGAQIRPAILREAGEAPIVIKHHADAFQETDLATQLEGIDELVIAGMMTQNCVVFTALSKAAERYRVTVAGDLCTAPLEIVHRIALNALASKTQVRTAAEIWA